VAISDQDVQVTVNEASYVLDQPSTVINKAVDEGIVKASVVRRGKLSSRVFGLPELRFYRVAQDLGAGLSPSGRRSIYQAIRHLPVRQRRLKWGPFETDLSKLDREIAQKLKRLWSLKRRIDEAEGPEPLIRGTKISAYVIAALAEGQTISEILEDYPGLSRAQVEAAVEYGNIYPKKGRPHPSRSFKRMAGDIGLKDIPIVKAEKGPREIKQ
jgi:uncharacterized protein (DUF433 family)